MILAPGDLAARNARRMAWILRALGGDGAPVAGGWMSSDRPGSWATFAAGLGVDAPVAGEAIDRLVDFYAERGQPARIEVTPYQHPSLFEALATRHFVLDDLESILFRATRAPPEPPAVAGLSLRRLDPADSAAVETFVSIQRDVFHGDPSTADGFDAITRRAICHPDTRAWLVEIDGEPAGAAALDLFEGQGHLFGGAVLPAFRRHGLQRTLIAHRIRAAAREGAHTVLVGSSPGATTERNALRAGFRVAFTQPTLKRAAPWNPLGT